MTKPRFGPLVYLQSNVQVAAGQAEAWPDETCIITTDATGKKSLKFGRLARHGETVEFDGVVYEYLMSRNATGGVHHTVKMHKAKVGPEPGPPPLKRITPMAYNGRQTKVTWFEDCPLIRRQNHSEDVRNCKLAAMTEAVRFVMDRYVLAKDKASYPDHMVVCHLAESLTDECLMDPSGDTSAADALGTVDQNARALFCAVRDGTLTNPPTMYDAIRKPMLSDSPSTSKVEVGPTGATSTLAGYIFDPENDHLASVKLNNWVQGLHAAIAACGSRDDCTSEELTAAAFKLCQDEVSGKENAQGIAERAKSAIQGKAMPRAYDGSAKSEWLEKGFKEGNSLNFLRESRATFVLKRLAALSNAAAAVGKRYRKNTYLSPESHAHLAEELTDLCAAKLEHDKVWDEIDGKARQLVSPTTLEIDTESTPDAYLSIKTPDVSKALKGTGLKDYIQGAADEDNKRKGQSCRLALFLEEIFALAKDNRFTSAETNLMVKTAVELCRRD